MHACNNVLKEKLLLYADSAHFLSKLSRKVPWLKYTSQLYPCVTAHSLNINMKLRSKIGHPFTACQWPSPLFGGHGCEAGPPTPLRGPRTGLSGARARDTRTPILTMGSLLRRRRRRRRPARRSRCCTPRCGRRWFLRSPACPTAPLPTHRSLCTGLTGRRTALRVRWWPRGARRSRCSPRAAPAQSPDAAAALGGGPVHLQLVSGRDAAVIAGGCTRLGRRHGTEPVPRGGWERSLPARRVTAGPAPPSAALYSRCRIQRRSSSLGIVAAPFTRGNVGAAAERPAQRTRRRPDYLYYNRD